MASKKQQRKQVSPRAPREDGENMEGSAAPEGGSSPGASKTTSPPRSPESAGTEMAAGFERTGELLRTAQTLHAQAISAEQERLDAASRADAMARAADTERTNALKLTDGQKDSMMHRAQGMTKAADTEAGHAKRAENERDRKIKEEVDAIRTLGQHTANEMTPTASQGPGPVVSIEEAASIDPRYYKPLPPTGRDGDGGPTPSYPILTEELGYPPSPVGGTAASPGGAPGGYSDRSGSMGSTVTMALQSVLGWKPNSKDASGFVTALNQSFSLKTEEGTVVSTWTPRSYAVQTDLAGGVSGAQASIYTMAKTLLDQMLPLLSGLTPLDPRADEETVAALNALITDQMTNLTNEIGNVGGPRVMRVHQYFQMLLGVHIHLELQPHAKIHLGSLSRKQNRAAENDASSPQTFPYWKHPDSVRGSLGQLREQLGLKEFGPKPFVNTVADEQNVTNFRILVDYINSLLGAWANSIRYFAGMQTPFLGTQLVIISRQLGVISETVDEVRFVLDSVFVGPAQRSTTLLDFRQARDSKHFPVIGPDRAHTTISPRVFEQLPPIYLEELLSWIQDFVGAEAKNVIQNGGRLGIGEDFKVMIAQLYTQAFGLYHMAQHHPPSAGMSTVRVQQSLYKLAQQLGDLFVAAAPVGLERIGAGH